MSNPGPNTRRARYSANRRERLMDEAAPAIFAFLLACAVMGTVLAIAKHAAVYGGA